MSNTADANVARTPSAIINDFYEEIFARNFDVALTAAAPSYFSHTEPNERDPASLRESCARMMEGLTDVTREVLFEFNDGDIGAVIHRCTGKSALTGDEVKMRSADFYKVEGGKLLEHWGALQFE